MNKERTRLTKKERSWIMYDCGNSAYSMAITTALLPVVYGMFTGGKGMDLGVYNSIASLLVAMLAPILGTIADYKDFKKRFFVFFAAAGVLFTGALAVVPDGQWQLLVVFYILTVLGFAGSNIFYDSFLVDVTTDDKMDSVSTKGFAWGYISSVIPFGISLAVVLLMGMDKLIGFQIGFIITALWWGLFTIPMIKNVNQTHYVEREPHPISMSFSRLVKTFKNIKKYKLVFGFLIAYFLYIDGVDTIIKMCVPYATGTLGLDPSDIVTLLGILLVIQIVAFPCAILYGVLAKKYGTRNMIIVGIVTYIIACTYAFFMNALWNIFVLGIMIGSAQGGIQALSRSYFAKIIPKKNSNEFFGFYNIFGKFAAIIGPLLMTLTVWIGQAGGMTYMAATKISIFAIVPLFVAGLLLFLRLPRETEIEAAEEVQ